MLGPTDWLNTLVGEKWFFQLSTKSAVIINASIRFSASIFSHSRLISNRPHGRLNPEPWNDACNACIGWSRNPEYATWSSRSADTWSSRSADLSPRCWHNLARSSSQQRQNCRLPKASLHFFVGTRDWVGYVAECPSRRDGPTWSSRSADLSPGCSHNLVRSSSQQR